MIRVPIHTYSDGCTCQIDQADCCLGNYEDEADAARAYDTVARVLGRTEFLNFLNPKEIIGRRSDSSDQKVAEAVQVLGSTSAAAPDGPVTQPTLPTHHVLRLLNY